MFSAVARAAGPGILRGMIISRGRNYIFVHIPKTGGTALATALEDRAMADDILIGDTPKALRRKRRLKGVETVGRLWKHSRLDDLPGLIDEDEMAGMFVFTLVRNPWDRMVSYYHWLREQSFDHPAVVLAGSLEFAEFLAHPQTQASIAQNPYGRYLRLPSGREHCSAFVRLENVAEELALVTAHLGWNLAMPGRINESARQRDYESYYTPTEIEIVARVCAEDIARFGYVFGGEAGVAEGQTRG